MNQAAGAQAAPPPRLDISTLSANGVAFHAAILRHPLHCIKEMALSVYVEPDGTQFDIADCIVLAVASEDVNAAQKPISELTLAELVCCCAHHRIACSGARGELTFWLKLHLLGPQADPQDPIALQQTLLH